MLKLALATAFGLIASASVAFAAPPVQKAETSLGTVLADEKGMTLYTFDKDEAGKSNCAGGCAANWPPLTAASDAAADGDYTVIDRADGTKQWAYKGEPLYLWVKDQKPGDVTGDGVGSVWHAAKP